MRRVHVLLWVPLVAILAGQLGPARAQAPPAGQTPPSFKSGITAVPIDVRAIDRDGKPVADLSVADFSVFEDDIRQPIVHFSREVLVGRAPGPPLRAQPDVPRFDAAPQPHRIFLLVLGAGALGSRPLGPGTAVATDASNALDGLLHLLRDRLLPQDQVALLAYSRATDFSTDHERIAAMLERFRESEEGGATAFASSSLPAGLRSAAEPPIAAAPADSSVSDAELGFAEFVNAGRRPVGDAESLLYGIKYLRFMPGEKHLVYLTAWGIGQPVPGSVEAMRTQPWESLTWLGAAANDARVAVHVIQTGGVPAATGSFLAPLPVMTPRILVPGQAQFGVGTPGTSGGGSGARALQPQPGFDRPPPDIPVPIPGFDATGLQALGGLQALARETGGVASIAADAGTAVDRIDAETRVAYLLAYQPLNPVADGRYRSIRVEVNRPGVTVRFRRGYHADAGAGSMQRRSIVADRRLIAAAASTRRMREIRISATPAFSRDARGKGGIVLLRMTIDPARLTWGTDDLSRRVAHLDVAAFCGARNRTVGQTRRMLDIALTDGQFEQVASHGLPYTVRIEVESPPTFVKVVVYDYAADLAGSIVVTMK